MTALPFVCPSPPDWKIDWPGLDQHYSWIHAMQDCPQDAVFHAEGDVWTHVRMVCEAMAALAEWRNLPDPEREVLFAAALLHDVAKPVCTRREDGRITSRGHSRRGAILARRILWELDADFDAREQVCALTRYHQSPFHLLNRADAQRMAFLISQTARCDLLSILARADILGRYCADRDELLDRVQLFAEFCREQHCLHAPRQFPSDQSRFEYFRTEGRDPEYRVHESPRCEVILMSGLPGAGKDTWIARHAGDLPRISLDAIREETRAAPAGDQGAVVAAAREQARGLLRESRSFVWNATNLTADLRSQLVDLFTAYQARVRIVYVESPAEELFRQNRQRAAEVPLAAIERMLDRWEVPSPIEAPGVEWWVNGPPRAQGSRGG